MRGKKPWLGVVLGTGLVLNGCAGMTKNQAALVGAGPVEPQEPAPER
jgi:hypothetical protein